ncbi:MAG: peptidylprolyl isomerase [Candidatus Aenigmatarchaeota archaeon]
MENGQFVKINYVGRVKGTDEIFDLTDEAIAKENKLHDPKTRYGPVTVIIGEQMILPGLEEEIKKMKAGEKKTIELPPGKAFGERDSKLLKTFGEAQFKRQEMNPIPGLMVELNGIRGRVMSVSAGRVSVDFNHPLSGKTITYEIEVIGIVEKDVEKAKSIVQIFSNADAEVEINAGAVEIKLPVMNNVHPEAKKKISEDVFKWLKADAVKFEETYRKPQAKADAAGKA